MGEITLDMHDFEGFINHLYNNKLWPSADGQIHKLEDMSVSHITNAIAKIKRDQWRLVYLPLFQQELRERVADIEFKLMTLKENIGDSICP